MTAVIRQSQEIAQMIRMILAGALGIGCLAGLAACDSTYTPSAHHHDDASTGSLLSGTDTGVNPNGSMNDPSLRSNFGSQNTGH